MFATPGCGLFGSTGSGGVWCSLMPHDDAYAWARRQRVTVNRATGAIEVRDVVAIEEQLPELSEVTTSADQRLFRDVSDADLTRLGIDEQLLDFARALVDVDQLEAARPILPEPQYDVLLGLAVGMTPEQVWSEVAGDLAAAEYDPEDVTGALERSSGKVVLVSGPDELMEVFSYPLALWRVYLHPAQHRAAYGSFSGPARVTGGPGTGKTVAALHRAHHLAKSSDADRSVLVTTFTKTLAAALEDGMNLLVDDAAVLRRIDIRHVDQVAYKVVARRHGRLQVIRTDEERERWQAAIRRFQLGVTPEFLQREWREVALAQNLMDLGSYLAAARAGRGQRLGSQQRARIWEALSDFELGLRSDGRWTYETICREATRILDERRDKPYRHIVVDEAQDFSPWQWRLLRAAVPRGADDIFIAGDTHQRIYGHRVSLKQVGIDIAGRSERLKINYRTTAEILGWSLGILHGEKVDDMNGDLDTLAGCRSQVHGPAPTLIEAPDRAAEGDLLIRTIRDWLEQGVEPEQIGVAARTGTMVDDAVAAFSRAGISAVSLRQRAARDGEVSVATMHRMKGLEFRCVGIVGAGRDYLPLRSAVIARDVDPASHDLDIQRERCLFFVACTRAREQLAWQTQPAGSTLAQLCMPWGSIRPEPRQPGAAPNAPRSESTRGEPETFAGAR